MPTFKTSQVVESKRFPGVKFKVRTLNVIKRATRDAAIAEHRLEYSRLSTEQRSLAGKLIGEGSTEFVSALKAEVAKLNLPEDHAVTKGLARFCSAEELAAKYDALSSADQAKLDAAQQGHTLVYQEHILPATIRAALISVEGLDFDGAEPTVETVLEHAPDELLDEIYEACANASGLPEDAQKN